MDMSEFNAGGGGGGLTLRLPASHPGGILLVA